MNRKLQFFRAYLLQLFIGIDQLLNTLFGGWADETMSSRLWRKSGKSKAWNLASTFVDALFRLAGQRDHCYAAYVSEQARQQMPVDLREVLSDLGNEKQVG